MNNNRLTAVAAAAVAAAVALAGCTSTVGGAGRPAALTTVTALPGAGPATSTAPAAVPSRWIDVTGQGDVDMGDLPQHGLRPAPGLVFGYFDPGSELCTIGPATSAGYLTAGYLTAGHCTDGGSGVATRAYLASDAHGSAPQESGWITHAATEPGADSAVFENSVAGTSWIAETWPVAGALTVAGVKQLPADAEICFDGAQSGVRCGLMIDTDDPYGFRFDAPSQGHDSGSPVFLVDRVTRAATLIGVLQGRYGDSTTGTTVATPIEPVLQRLDVDVLVDQAVAVPTSTPGYSNRMKGTN